MPESNAFDTRPLFLIMTMNDIINPTHALIEINIGDTVNTVEPSVMSIKVNLGRDGLAQQKENKRPPLHRSRWSASQRKALDPFLDGLALNRS